MHNIRVMRNRGSTRRTALSAQPIFGGPAALHPQRRSQHAGRAEIREPAGVVVLHNTFIAENRTAQRVSNADFRNNLFLGTDARTGIAVLGGPTAYSIYDYNGYRPNRGADAQYTWLGTETRCPRRLRRRAETGAAVRDTRDLAAATGQETHGIEVDYDIFEDCARPRRPTPRSRGFPTKRRALELRLKAGKAVDAGVRPPNVNDAFSGRARSCAMKDSRRRAGRDG